MTITGEMLIGASAVRGTEETFYGINPATGELIGVVPNMGRGETRRAIEAAQAAQPAWRALTAKERAERLRRWYELMLENQEDLARIMTAEQGKPLAEARGEIAYAASFIEWFAEEAKRIYGDTIPGHQKDKRIIVIKQPIGVTAAGAPGPASAAAGDVPEAFPGREELLKLAPAREAGFIKVPKVLA